MTTPIRVAVTGAGGQIGYALLFRLASGELFGPAQPVALQLLEITPALPALGGTLMELEDCAFPHNPRAHSLEHALEVQLPFLQATLGSFLVVPIAVGDAQPEEVAAVIERLWGGPETLIVVSSDLSHYLPYADAQRADAASAKEILALGQLRRSDACGAVAVNGLLLEARRRVLRAELVDLRSSGDTAGDRDRVVGYGAFAFYERPA